MRLSNFHLVVSSFAAVAGVTLAAYQTLAPASPPPQQPVTVPVAVGDFHVLRERVAP